MILKDFIETIFSKFTERAYKEQYIERSAFDPISLETFRIIFGKYNRHDVCDYSYLKIARFIHATRKQVWSRCRHLSRYGLITVQYRPGIDPGKDCTNLIRINPILTGMFKDQAGTKNLMTFIDHYHKVGMARLECDGIELQGFFTDCEYGTAEPENGPAAKTWQNRLIDFVKYNDENKAARRRDELTWLELSRRFMDASAALWTRSQGELGYGYNKAVWDGEPSTLGATPKKERMELIKLFQTYGGFITAVAWYIFCCGIPQKDSKGRLQFDLRSPHRQFVTVDKKPSQFAKHFNAILSDEIYIDMTTANISETEHMLSEFYGDLLGIKPRYDFCKNEFE